MSMQALVVGATGDVGRGVARQLLQAGWHVVAAGRRPDKLAALQAELAQAGTLQTVVGSVEDTASAHALWQAAGAGGARFDAVIVTVNGQFGELPLSEVTAGQLEDVLRQNLFPHLAAAQAIVPALADGATYLAIGGGMADLVFPGRGPISICQAAQRMVFRHLAEEWKDRPVRVHELMLYSMIAGHSNRASADPRWLTDEDVGRHVLAVLERPDWFNEPILTLKSRKAVAQQPLPSAAKP